MILFRIIESQSSSTTWKLTDTPEEHDLLEDLIEKTKPILQFGEYHYLIATPFRYSLPVPPQYSARFKPEFWNRNAFYGAEKFPTAAFEYTYHWLRQRVHITGLSQVPQPRTLFAVGFHDPDIFDLRTLEGIDRIMDRNSYIHSHNFIRSHANLNSVLYPSCRDPKMMPCVITFSIQTLEKKPTLLRTITLRYEERARVCHVEDPSKENPNLSIAWNKII